MKVIKLALNIFVVCFVIFAIISCDKIDAPFTELTPVDTTAVTDTTKYIRKVLVEDYTGHTCGNCPDAARSLDSILSRNADKVVAMAVHAGFFAEIKPTGLYTYDFRNTDGNELDAFFGISVAGNPNGMVNRIGYSQSHVKAHTAWSGIVATELAKEAEANIKLEVTYNSSTRSATIKSTSKFLKELTGSYKLSLFITEDSIVRAQKDYKLPSPSNISEYTHRHAMRVGVNGTWGEEIAAGTIAKDKTVEKTHSYTLKTNWVEGKCHVVAFIYNAATYEIIQAEEAHITGH